jgi:hypothetical protein
MPDDAPRGAAHDGLGTAAVPAQARPPLKPSDVTPSTVPPTSFRRSRFVGRALFAAALLVALSVGSRGITDEGRMSVVGDMPRYLTTGTFLYDYLRSDVGWTFDSAMTFAQHYFAQYPALSIGHHPPLLPICLVPFYAIFGVSVFAARLAILAFFVLSVVLLYTLVDRVYDEEVAGWACLLFVSSPIIAGFAQKVLSEIPTIALVLGALNALVRFRDSGRFRDYLLFVVLAVGSLASRQLAVFMWPAYLALLVTHGGWTRLARRDVITLTLAGATLVVAMTIATVRLSPFSVAIVRDVFHEGLVLSRVQLLGSIFRAQLLPALWFVTAAGLLVALLRRDQRIMLGVYWMVSVLTSTLLITGRVEPVRYSIFAVPAYCVCAASLVGTTRSPVLRRLVTVGVALAVAWPLWSGRGMRPARMGGYEEAARFVLADADGQSAPTVLYSASADSGAFVFFIRKHDPAHRLVVLRSDKLLTTSLMGQLSVEDRIRSPQEIYPLLNRYGTRFIVIEDMPSGSTVLDWLRDELRGDRFTERRRIAVDPSDSSRRGPALIVYEYNDAGPPDPDAEIDLKLPLVGREVRVRLSALGPRLLSATEAAGPK